MEKGQKFTVKNKYWKVTIVNRDVICGNMEELEDAIKTIVNGLFFDVLKDTVDNDE